MTDKGRDFPPTAHMDAEAIAARNRRNVWLALALAGFVVLVGVITVVRLSDTNGEFYYRFDKQVEADEEALPPGMSPDQAAPPPGLTPEPASE